MKEDGKTLPPVNQRIKNIIEEHYNGSVRKFSIAMGITEYQKINRLFILDKRNGKYPKPSIDILSNISNTFNISIEWLQTGYGNVLKSENVATNHNLTTMELSTLLKAIEQHGEELRKHGERLDRMLDIIAPIEQSHVG